MSLTDSILSNTVGVAFRAVTGNVDPWTLQQQKDEGREGGYRIFHGFFLSPVRTV